MKSKYIYRVLFISFFMISFFMKSECLGYTDSFVPPVHGGIKYYNSPVDSGSTDLSKPEAWYSMVWTGRYSGNAEIRVEGTGGHPGVDIRDIYGRQTGDFGVYAIANGIIIRKRFAKGWGNFIVIKHDNVEGYGTIYSAYAHLENFEKKIREVEEGRNRVSKGEKIGVMGTSGGVPRHLHFQIDKAWPEGKNTPFWPKYTEGNKRLSYPSTQDKNGVWTDAYLTEAQRQEAAEEVRRNTINPMRLVENGTINEPFQKETPIPEFYGVYLVANGKLIELIEISDEELKILYFIIGHPVGGLESLSGINIQDNNCYFIVYKKYVIPEIIRLARMKFVRNLKSYKANMWRPDSYIELKVAPIEGKADMYRLVPKKSPLDSGVYLLYSGTLSGLDIFSFIGYDFAIDFEEYKLQMEAKKREESLAGAQKATKEEEQPTALADAKGIELSLSSLSAEEPNSKYFEEYKEIIKSDFNMVWQSSIRILKDYKADLNTINKEKGIIITNYFEESHFLIDYKKKYYCLIKKVDDEDTEINIKGFQYYRRTGPWKADSPKTAAYGLIKDIKKEIKAAFTMPLESKVRDPKKAESHIKKAQNSILKHKYIKAREELKEAISFDSLNFEAHLLLGSIYGILNMDQEGKTVTLKAMELNPDDPRAYYNMACFYSRQKEIDKAIEWLEKAVEKGLMDYENIKEKMEKDADLDNIRNDPRYQILIKN